MPDTICAATRMVLSGAGMANITNIAAPGSNQRIST
jgi:hypothetical protein